MRRMMFLIILAIVAMLAIGCLYWMPMHAERPGTNREALGTTDTLEPEMLDGPGSVYEPTEHDQAMRKMLLERQATTSAASTNQTTP